MQEPKGHQKWGNQPLPPVVGSGARPCFNLVICTNQQTTQRQGQRHRAGLHLVEYISRRKPDKENQHGSLLDQTMVVYGSSLSDGHEHAAKNLPVLLAGGGSTITQGRRLGDRNDTSMSDLHLAMLQHLGIPMKQFAETRSPLVLA